MYNCINGIKRQTWISYISGAIALTTVGVGNAYIIIIAIY